MKKIVLSAILFIGMIVGSSVSFAGSEAGVTVRGVGCLADGICFANINKAVGPSFCTNRQQLRWDGTSSSGKNFTASMLTAKAGQINVNIGFDDVDCFQGASQTHPQLTFLTVQ